MYKVFFISIINIFLLLLNPLFIKIKVFPPFLVHLSIWLNNFFSAHIHPINHLTEWIVLFLSINFLLYIVFFIKHIITKSFSHKQLRKFSSVSKLQKMDWEDYEELIKQVFVAKGYNVERIGGHGSDGGIDLVVKKKNERSMVQCKRYSSNVGVKIIREMYAVGLHHGFKKVYIYTTANFTKEAYVFAKGKNLVLYNGVQTVQQIRKILKDD